MEPIGLCGGGLVALILFLVAAVGSATLAGAIALALAKLGVTVDEQLRSVAHNASSDEKPATPEQPTRT
jgi:archaellum component FlaG (FlaF/FlaG flagellin family)